MSFKAASYVFRQEFHHPNRDLLRWFPGHMAKGMAQMQQKLKQVDCIIEVHDARIPLSGRNPRFKKTLSIIKPHILVLNKVDLAEPSKLRRFKDYIEKEENTKVVFTNCKDHSCRGVKQLMPMMTDMIKNSERYHRSNETEFYGMIIGVPNVGKSSLINTLRNRYLKKGNATAVGAVAGITRSLLTRIKISEDPVFFMLDTPGILEPIVSDIEMGFKLALCACTQDHLVGEPLIADYLLYWLNKHDRFNYVDLMGLDEPTDDISKVLNAGALKLNKFQMTKVTDDGQRKILPNLNEAARYMLKAYRTGQLGRTVLDKDFFAKTEEEQEKDNKENNTLSKTVLT